MNLIQRQAEDFLESHHDDGGGDQKEFVQNIQHQLLEYRKTPHKLEFLHHITFKVKVDYDKHIQVCTTKPPKVCGIDRYFEDSLFFIQQEIDELNDDLGISDFNEFDKVKHSGAMVMVVDDLRQLKLGQEVLYDDILSELNELKQYYFLEKSSWKQMLLGKLMEMIAKGVISEAVSNEIVDLVGKKFS